MVIYKLNSKKKMTIDEQESSMVTALWLMYEESFKDVPHNYSLKLQGKKVFLCTITLNEPKPPDSYELSLAF